MRGRAGFHPNQTRGQLLKRCKEGSATYLVLQDDLALSIHAVNLKDRLGQINTNRANIHVGGSFLLPV